MLFWGNSTLRHCVEQEESGKEIFKAKKQPVKSAKLKMWDEGHNQKKDDFSGYYMKSFLFYCISWLKCAIIKI